MKQALSRAGMMGGGLAALMAFLAFQGFKKEEGH